MDIFILLVALVIVFLIMNEVLRNIRLKLNIKPIAIINKTFIIIIKAVFIFPTSVIIVNTINNVFLEGAMVGMIAALVGHVVSALVEEKN